jgi:CheY-like chemotaxis protein
VLEPFFTTKPVGEGSGLGLSMVYGFAVQSGGQLDIASELGRGTTMRIFLPKTGQPEVAPVAPTEIAAPAGGRHVLLVEDDDLVRGQVERQLLALGYRVTSRANGREALKVIGAATDIDLLLTDIVMPGGMNGRQLADHARLLLPGLRVLLTSGYNEDVIVRTGRLDEATAFLAKPYRRAELARKISAVLKDGQGAGACVNTPSAVL